VPERSGATATRTGDGRRRFARAAGRAAKGTVALLVAATLAGCAAAGQEDRDGRLSVVTTVAPITSIVASVGGDHVRVNGIVPEGTNSHTFEPRPSVAELLAGADVLYLNGLQLEEPTRDLAEEVLPDGAGMVELGGRAIARDEYAYDFSFPRSGGKPNPHLWTDPSLALEYAAIVRDDLSARDPANAAAYAANHAAFAAMVGRLDAAMRASFATIPRADRKLLTYHDAYAYFARSYGWTVIGAIQVADFDEPAPREVARLIDQVRSADVPAIFGSEVFPSPVLEQIGREAGVRYVDVLRDDDLPGDPGDPEHSWAGLMRFDFVTITEALGGDASALRAVDIGGLPADRARYPQ
jgi:ABC-type Zn uptake system ZnuABC Zn-binding protein ZnuA